MITTETKLKQGDKIFPCVQYKEKLYFVEDELLIDTESESIEMYSLVYCKEFGVGQIIMKYDEECFYKEDKQSGGSITTPWRRNLEDSCRRVVAQVQIEFRTLPLISEHLRAIQRRAILIEVDEDFRTIKVEY